MINFSFSTDKNTVNSQEAINLYVQLNWGSESQYSTETMQKALQNSSFIVSVRNENGKLIGLTRCLSDGAIHTTVTDIVVHPDYQNKGIGQEMMNFVKSQYGHTGIFIDGFRKNEKFFEGCGFVKRDMLVLSKKFSR